MNRNICGAKYPINSRLMCCAGVCVCATHVCSTCRGQRSVSDLLELALQSIVTKWLLRTEPGTSALSALDCQIIFFAHTLSNGLHDLQYEKMNA